MAIVKKKPSEWSAATKTAVLVKILGSLNGLLKADGGGGLSVAEAGQDYQIPNISINEQTGTTYTLVLADAGKYVRCTNAASISVTVPTNASVAFDTGTVITIEQGGAGTVTVAGDGGVTVNGYDSGLSTAGQYAAVQLLKTGTDEWTCIGGTS